MDPAKVQPNTLASVSGSPMCLRSCFRRVTRRSAAPINKSVIKLSVPIGRESIVLSFLVSKPFFFTTVDRELKRRTKDTSMLADTAPARR